MRLLCALYVDVDPLEKTRLIEYTRLWSGARTQTTPQHTFSDISDMGDIKAAVFQAMQDSCQKGAQEEYQPDATEQLSLPQMERRSLHIAHLASASLDTAALLANFGILTLGNAEESQEVGTVCELAVDALEMKSDSILGTETKDLSTPMQVVVSCQIKACHLLAQLFDMRVNRRMTKLLEAYEGHFEEPQDKQARFKEVQDAVFNKPVISAAVADGSTRGDFVASLLALTATADEELSQCVFTLLFRHMTQKSTFIREVKQARILVLPEAVKVYHTVQAHIKRLNTLKNGVSLKSTEAIQSTFQILRSLCALCTAEAESHQLNVILHEYWGHQSELDDEDEQGFTADVVAKHQDVLRNLDAHSVVLGLLQLPLERIPCPGELDTVSDEERKRLFQTCYDFLRVFCKGNTTNQEIVFSQTELFFAHVGIAKLDVASTIAESVRDNRELSAQVNEKILRKFVQTIVRYGKRARWLHFLETFVVVNGRPLKRNQDMIMRLLLQEEDEVVLELDGDQEGEREGDKSRASLMMEREHEVNRT